MPYLYEIFSLYCPLSVLLLLNVLCYFFGKYMSIQMVALVAYRAGKKLGTLKLKLISVSVLRLNLYIHRPLDLAEDPGEAETALAAVLRARALYYLRIYQLYPALADIYYDRALYYTDLRRGKTHSLRLSHRVVHIVKKYSELFVELFYLLAAFSQYFIIMLTKLSYSHFISSIVNI